MKARDIHELVKATEARNFTLAAQLVYECALERKESRLCHYREEFPYRDDVEWLRWVTAKRGKKGRNKGLKTDLKRFLELQKKPQICKIQMVSLGFG